MSLSYTFSQLPAFMNFQISVEVEGDGFPADISCFKKIADLTIKTELSEIRGKYE